MSHREILIDKEIITSLQFDIFLSFKIGRVFSSLLGISQSLCDIIASQVICKRRKLGDSSKIWIYQLSLINYSISVFTIFIKYIENRIQQTFVECLSGQINMTDINMNKIWPPTSRNL